MALSYSFIIPVYNRPREIQELLMSFTHLDTHSLDYEIVIVEDGSKIASKSIVKQYATLLPVRYFEKENSGAGQSRNYGMERARGTYFIILDSDVLLPKNYLITVDRFLKADYYDCFGGADKAHEDFSPAQKAINFAMTSFLTTGGIRGSKRAVENFKPRSFNMGLSKKAFNATGGFRTIKIGEDLDLSIRIAESGFKTAFIPGAFVYHKRRNNWKSFYQQVSRFGTGRPVLNLWYPRTSSLFFWLPSLFTLGLALSLLLLLFKVYLFIKLYLLYFLAVFILASLANKDLKVGVFSVFAVFIQFLGYGIGFLKSKYYINFKGKDPEEAFPDLFTE